MIAYPKSPLKTTKGMCISRACSDKIWLHARGELHEDLCQRVAEGGTDEEILEWCFEIGRRLNEGDIVVWNGFASKLGWRDFVRSSWSGTNKNSASPIGTTSPPSRTSSISTKDSGSEHQIHLLSLIASFYGYAFG